MLSQQFVQNPYDSHHARSTSLCLFEYEAVFSWQIYIYQNSMVACNCLQINILLTIWYCLHQKDKQILFFQGFQNLYYHLDPKPLSKEPTVLQLGTYIQQGGKLVNMSSC